MNSISIASQAAHVSRGIVVSNGSVVTEFVPMPLDPNMSAAQRLFRQKFDQVSFVLPYDSAWENGTGYFDSMCHSVELNALVQAQGGWGKFVDSFGRRALVLATPWQRPVVLFERYNGAVSPIVAQTPGGSECSHWDLDGGVLLQDEVERFVSATQTYLGEVLTRLVPYAQEIVQRRLSSGRPYPQQGMYQAILDCAAKT